MTNIRPLMKRVCAYMIDLFLVLIIASIISNIPVFNKRMDNYRKTYSEYEEKYNEYAEYLKSFESLYEDSEITEEEYNELIKEENYKDLITSRYEDKKISKGEYNQIVEEVNNKFDSLAKNYVYILKKEGVSNSIINLSCTLIYFGIIQYFLKGETLGKKLLKLKIVSASTKKLNILNYIFRSLIVNDVFLNGIDIIFLLSTSKNIYIQADNILGILISVCEAVIIFLVLTREDQRGLHDLLFNTKVISTEEIKETPKEEATTKNKKKVIEADYKEGSDKNGKKSSKKTSRKK